MTELSRSELFWVNVVGDRFEEAWQHGGRPQIEDYVGDETATRRAILLAHLLGIELERRCGLGETPRGYLTRDMKKVPPAPDQILLRTGDQVRIEVCASQPGYITIFNVGPTGNLNLLHRDEPSLAGLAAAIPRDRPLQIHDIEMTAPAGRERLFAVWSRLPLPLPLDQMHGLIERAETAATDSRPYVATRDMKRVQQAVGKLAPTEWRAIAIELDHSSQ
jgi:hypothetical protein